MYKVVLYVITLQWWIRSKLKVLFQNDSYVKHVYFIHVHNIQITGQYTYTCVCVCIYTHVYKFYFTVWFFKHSKAIK